MSVVAISRQYGAGGSKIAEEIARRLGCKLTNEAVVNEVARKAGISAQRVEEAEKTFGDVLLSLFNEIYSTDPAYRHIPGISTEFDEDRYRIFLRKAILELTHKKPAVILGRGAHIILKDQEDVIRIGLVAREEDRIAAIMRNFGLDQKKAEHIARDEEKKRVQFLKSFDQGDPESPLLFHLVINTSCVRYEQAVQAIVSIMSA